VRKAASFWAALLLGGTAMAADFTGTWKLNLEKSPGTNPNIASETMKLEQTGPNAYRTTIDIVQKSGNKTHHEINRVYDGQEHQVSMDGSPLKGTEICEITEAGVRKITMKENRKVVEVIMGTISADGNTMTHTVSTDKGQNVAIFDKQ
jgi:hypothetical protein